MLGIKIRDIITNYYHQFFELVKIDVEPSLEITGLLLRSERRARLLTLDTSTNHPKMSERIGRRLVVNLTNFNDGPAERAKLIAQEHVGLDRQCLVKHGQAD